MTEEQRRKAERLERWSQRANIALAASGVLCTLMLAALALQAVMR